MKTHKYPITWEVSDVLKITMNGDHDFTVHTAKMGYSKKHKKPVITWDKGFTSNMKHALKMGLQSAFDSDLMKVMDRMDEVEATLLKEFKRAVG